MVALTMCKTHWYHIIKPRKSKKYVFIIKLLNKYKCKFNLICQSFGIKRQVSKLTVQFEWIYLSAILNSWTYMGSASTFCILPVSAALVLISSLRMPVATLAIENSFYAVIYAELVCLCLPLQYWGTSEKNAQTQACTQTVLIHLLNFPL